ncbi:MAG: iron-sulfur cluster assembly scaffold protein [Patescibacteria group bacterium]|jgi:nitrogen fixation NifU-like protein
MTDNIYQELILELARNPLNKSTPASFDNRLKAENRVCGDNLTFFISWSKSGAASEVAWDGDGCALSVSSASLFSEYLKGKTKSEIKKIKPAQILKLLKMKKLNPSRTRCALLPLESVQSL